MHSVTDQNIQPFPSHAELDGLNRIGGLEAEMGAFVVGDQYQQDFKQITLLGTRLRQGIEPGGKLLLGLVIVVLGMERSSVHQDLSTLAALILSYSA
ncbi:hypothetical protein B8X02_08420 [Stenotrophomonas rhizophila]|nr:hypothetical protein B8X02_08420 [Stenotrophomonas rhizophila]